MAIRTIVKEGDEVLRKVCRPVEKFDQKLNDLIQDLADTMYQANGVGLAAPQVGILKRVAVVDVGDGLFEFINPRIVESSGEQIGTEGCLSCPGVWGTVKRPNVVTVEAYDRNGERFLLTANELFARAICHEFDHLDGKLFKDFVIEYVSED
ncbi:MAG TPA: peptide deformylase [Ruminococcaceae bacterium]|nr:peptide deformylase [Oscillospiraceae bacterium]